MWVSGAHRSDVHAKTSSVKEIGDLSQGYSELYCVLLCLAGSLLPQAMTSEINNPQQWSEQDPETSNQGSRPSNADGIDERTHKGSRAGSHQTTTKVACCHSGCSTVVADISPQVCSEC